MSATLRTLRYAAGAADLLVLLPGAYMTPAQFADNGFVAAVDRRGLALDLVAVDLDLEVISGGGALATVHSEILAPARADYAHVWLGGISLGGLLALCQAADAPGSVDGLCLLAPYPGSRLTTNSIARAGGLERWQPGAGELEDPEFRVWDWLRRPPPDLPAFVGWGSDDRFAVGMAEIAGRFPPAARCALPGGHEWPVWRDLWERFLDLGYFAGRAVTRRAGGT